MKKILVFLLVLVSFFTINPYVFAGSHGRYAPVHRPVYHRDGHNNAGAAVIGGLVGLGLGVILGPVISQPREVYSPPPPVYSSPYSSPDPDPQYSYSQSAFSWQGVRVVVSDRGGWGEEASVRGIVIDAFRSLGAEVILSSGYGNRTDAPYSLEIQTRSEGYCAVVELWLIERATGAVRLHGLGAAEFYYDGSDRWRSYQWAAQRALANLR